MNRMIHVLSGVTTLNEPYDPLRVDISENVCGSQCILDKAPQNQVKKQYSQTGAKNSVWTNFRHELVKYRFDQQDLAIEKFRRFATDVSIFIFLWGKNVH